MDPITLLMMFGIANYITKDSENPKQSKGLTLPDNNNTHLDAMQFADHIMRGNNPNVPQDCFVNMEQYEESDALNMYKSTVYQIEIISERGTLKMKRKIYPTDSTGKAILTIGDVAIAQCCNSVFQKDSVRVCDVCKTNVCLEHCIIISDGRAVCDKCKRKLLSGS